MDHLCSDQWQIIKPILETQRKVKHEKRTIFNAILWILTTGSQSEPRRWRNLESQFPAWQTVYYHFNQWKKNGVLEEVLDKLAIKARTKMKRKSTPSMLVIDSQSVKITQFTYEETGIDGAKWINGRKRHVAVDSLGIPWALVVTAANVCDSEGGEHLAQQLKGKSTRLEILKLEILKADKGYKTGFVEHIQKNYGWQVEIVQKPESSKGFVPVGGRWVVERSFGWLNFKRRLSRDVEKTVESSEAMLQIAFIDILLRRFF
ncbi:IS5 family transposase [Cytophagaceae bacterium DM2B3-1]|uniref:IS5 family transposase n=1 Tax=Xanthocytophaga flava TaxID=3048013 RepID=A0ABT7CEN8_9BACT|nr:IS5 family transposase [Xanthocytophaga flavus]MDJ1492168.1 IS5 family transposase [Xanthocytophaga flavus]